jgi:hypothetical protein
VLAHQGNQAWTIPYPELCFDRPLAGQRHVERNNLTAAFDIVNTRRAYSLDRVTLTRDQNNAPLHAQDLLLAVHCFGYVQAAVHLGDDREGKREGK